MDDKYGIKPEWRESWCLIASTRPSIGPLLNVDHITDLAVHLLAGWMRRDFLYQVATGCVIYERNDPRHDYKYDDWCRVARGELGR